MESSDNYGFTELHLDTRVKSTDLLSRALSLPAPWYVEGVECAPESGELAVHLNFEVGGSFACGECGTKGCKAYDTARKYWRHLDFLGRPCHLSAPSPRVVCPVCGIRQAALPWARSRKGYTRAFETHVVNLAREMPVRAASRLVGEHDTRLWRIVNDHEEAI